MYNCRCRSMQMVSGKFQSWPRDKKTISYHTPSQAITPSLWISFPCGRSLKKQFFREHPEHKSLKHFVIQNRSHWFAYILITHTHYVHSGHPSWASASRRPVLAFRNPASQSGTGAFQYRTVQHPYSDTRLVPASAFLFIPTPNTLHAGQSDIPAFKHNFPKV